MKYNIILDPAHGSDVAGKRSPDETHLEYKWSRDRCKNLEMRLKHLGYNVFYTSEFTTEIGISKRKNIANKIVSKHGNSLLISLHNDAFDPTNSEQWTEANGFSVYTSKGQTNSDKFAEILLKEFIQEFPDLKLRSEPSDKDLDKEENFTVLMGNYSAVLVEWLFQNNKNDLLKLKDNKYNLRFEECIVKAIEKFNK